MSTFNVPGNSYTVLRSMVFIVSVTIYGCSNNQDGSTTKSATKLDAVTPSQETAPHFATPNSVYAAAATALLAGKYEDYVSCFDVKTQEIMLGMLVVELSNMLPQYEKPDHPAASKAKQIRDALNSHKLNEEAIAKLNLPNIRTDGALYDSLSSVAKVVDDRALCLAELIRAIRESKFPTRMIPTFQDGELQEVKIEGDSATAVQPGPNGGKLNFLKVESNWLIQLQLL